jgi:hypothetical protein
MDLVYECFVKLGLRYVCVTKEGRYAGMVSLLTDAILLLLIPTVDAQEDICKVHAGIRRKGRSHVERCSASASA